MISPELTDLPLFAPRQNGGALEAGFWMFHAANPGVYRLLVRLAREWQAATGKRIGIKCLFERARWEIGVQTAGDEYSLNNNHTAFYARLIMQQEADLCGLFNLREQKTKMERITV